MFGREHGTPPGAEDWKAPKDEGAPLKEVSEEEIDAALDFGEAKTGEMLQSEKVIEDEKK